MVVSVAATPGVEHHRDAIAARAHIAFDTEALGDGSAERRQR
jgi:hypothetical protein